MAIDFEASSSQYLVTGAAPHAAVPLTMSFWFNSESTNNQVSLWYGRGATTRAFYLQLNGSQNVDAVTNLGGTFAVATTSTTWGTSAWHHACGVFDAVDSRAAFLDGGGKGTDATSVTPVDINVINIGSYYGGARSNFHDGLMADIAIWNAALSDAEVVILAAGYSPLFVRPQSLFSYWPLVGRHSPAIDVVGGYDATWNASPVAAAHAPIFFAAPAYYQSLATSVAAAVPIFSADAMHSTIFGGQVIR